jgi:hypothetical protein
VFKKVSEMDRVKEEEDEVKEYGVLTSILSRGKFKYPILIDDVLEDSRDFCNIPELHFAPHFKDRSEVISTVASTDYLEVLDSKHISFNKDRSVRLTMYDFRPPNENKMEHFDLTLNTSLYLADYLLNHKFGPPLILLTNRFNANKLFPIEGNISLEPDIIVILRDRRSEALFGFRKRVAVEAQRTGLERLYDKLEKYAKLQKSQPVKERMYLLVVLPEEKAGFAEEFRGRANEMEWMDEIDYRIIVSGSSKFKGLPD